MTNRADPASGRQASREDPAGATPANRVALALTASGLAAEIDARDGVISPNAHVVLKRRYLSKDKTGNILEDVDGMFERVSPQPVPGRPELRRQRGRTRPDPGRIRPGDAKPGGPAQLPNPHERWPGAPAALRLLCAARRRLPSTTSSTASNVPR